MKSSFKNLSIIVFIILVLPSSVVLAHPNTITLTPDSTNQKSGESRCQFVSRRVDALIVKYVNIKTSHTDIYQNAIQRMQKLATRLTNTEKLKTDISELESKMQKYDTAVQIAIESLNNGKTAECGNKSTDFFAAVTRVKNQLNSIKSVVFDLKSFFENTIMGDLKALQKKSI